MIRRKQFSYFNNFTGAMAYEYKTGATAMCKRVCLQYPLNTFLLKILHQAVRGALPLWPSTTRTQGTHGSDANATHPPSTSYSPSAGPGSCPRTGASHSRGKEILCKNTGSQRRQDSGQAWQGFCVNSSEQADFAQRG